MIRKTFQTTILILALTGVVGCGRLTPTLRLEHTIRIEGKFTLIQEAREGAEIGSSPAARTTSVEVAAVR